MNIDYNDLQAQMLRTAHFDEPRDKAFGLCALGLTGEAGEVADLVKKVFYHGKPFDREKLIEEGGDLAWYVAYLAHTIGFKFNDLINHDYAYSVFENRTEGERFTRLGCLLTSHAGDLAEILDFVVFEAPAHFEKEKSRIQGHLMSLLGWLESLATVLKSSLQEMFERNIVKLEKRYPNGFNTADSLARKDEVVAPKWPEQ